MNFFDHQEAARRQTRVLLVYYVLAVVSIVVAFYLASRVIAYVGLGVCSSDESGVGHRDPISSFRLLAWDPLWMLFTAGISLVVIVCGTLYRRASLSAGGSSVAQSAGGREIKPSTQDLNERKLINVVEEVALASGVPVPRVFVLDGETGINAFAAGFTLRDAAIAVTQGAMERLRREELQGVVAHEFSHILNGDMRLNSWLIGVLFGILATSVIGRTLMEALRFVRVSGNRKGGSGGIVLLVFLSGLALWLIGSIGVFFARLIQCSVSRQREFLADASAVQFTRDSQGLAGALKRIGALTRMNTLRCSNRDELSHLLFASSSVSGFDGLYATHPPLKDRILRLDPSFNGNFAPWALAEPVSDSTTRPTVPCGAAAPVCGLAAEASGATSMGDTLDFLMRLPPESRESVSQPEGATGVLYGLLLSEDSGVRQRQRDRVIALEGAAMAASAERWREMLRNRDRVSRRMFAELAVESCRHRDPKSRATCIGLVKELAEADGAVSLFEYMLQTRALRGLSPAVSLDVCRKPLPPAQVKVEAAAVLAMLAYAGQPTDDALAEAAWRAGAAHATSFGVEGLLPVRESCTLDVLDRALVRLGGLSPLLKGELITACSFVVRADGTLTPDEAELLRSVADMLDMPLPPM